MKILYGVQGTGNGHITRARVMAKALQKHNIAVDWIFSGRPRQEYFDMSLFGKFQNYKGLTFSINNGKINFAKTIRRLDLIQFLQDINDVNLSGYDCIINDFEPITAWAAKRQKKFTIGLSHQSAFHYQIPKKGSNPIAQLIMKWFAPVSLPIGIHWHHYDQIILPPFIEQGQVGDIKENKILVYFPFISVEKLCDILSPLPDYEFHIYHNVKEPKIFEHIYVHPFSLIGFNNDFKDCSGVICGAGFELPSEAIQMGKKILVQPVKGQMEQSSNAFALSQLNAATVTNHLSPKVIKSWLNSPQPRARPYPPCADYFCRWLTKGEWQDTASLRDLIWHENALLNQ